MAAEFRLPPWGWEWHKGLWKRRRNTRNSGSSSGRPSANSGDPVQAGGDGYRGGGGEAVGLPGGLAGGSQGRTIYEGIEHAKLFASEVAVRVANECVQIHGGYGFIKDYPAEEILPGRETFARLAKGPAKFRKLVIARQLLGRNNRVMRLPASESSTEKA